MKSVYKYLLVIAVSVLVTNFAMAQATLSLPTMNAASGNVAVNVNASGLNDMVSFQFTVNYDNTKLTYVGISNWYSGISNVMVNNNSSQGYITFSYFNVTPVSLSNGVFFTINFTYSSGVANLVWSNTPTPINIMTSAGQEIIPAITNGSVNPLQNYTITTSSNPTAGGTTSGGGIYQNGQSCTVTAIENMGFAFSHWTKNGITVANWNPYIFTVTEDRNLVANFECVLPLSNISGDTSLCEGSVKTYSVYGQPYFTSYVWTLPAGWSGSSSTNSISCVVGSVGGIISVSAINPCGVTPPSTMNVSVTQLPGNAGIITGETTVCQNATNILYTTSSISDANNYLWSYSGSGAFINGTSNSVAINFSANATSGNLIVKGVNECGEGLQSSLAIQLLQNSSIEVYNVSGGGTYCLGWQTINVGLDGSQVGATYKLYHNGNYTNQSAQGTGEALNFNFWGSEGVYTITAENNCETIQMQGSAIIENYPLPIVYNITGGGAYCGGNEGVSIGLDDSDVGISYYLVRNGTITGASVLGTGEPVSFGKITGSGNYTVGASIACAMSWMMNGSVSIEELDSPVVYMLNNAGTYLAGAPGVSIELVSSQIGINYEVFKNGNPTGIIVNGTGNTIVFNPQTAVGTYSIIATNPANGCQTTMTGEVILEQLVQDSIQLNTGWNLISMDVIPQNAQATAVFSSLIGSNNLVEVKGFHGQQEVVFKPSNPSGNNTLTTLVPGMGYWVKVVDAAILTVEGSAIPEDYTINLNAGWNLVGYWPQQSGTVTTAMQQLVNAGIFEGISGFATEGKFFDPQVPLFLNSLETISNSKGYWLKLSSAFNNFKYNESTTINDGLVAYYPFNGNAQDESGTGNNGTIIGNVSMTTDRFGNANSAYDFPGLPFNYINVPHSESLSLDTMTLIAWIYSETDYGHGQIIQKNRDIESGHYGLYTQSIHGNISYGNSVYAFVNEPPEIGSWHMVAGILYGSTAQFYVDGLLMHDTVAPSAFNYSGTQPLAIGMHFYQGVPDYWTYPYKGKLDDLRIYERVLSPSEISALYHEGGWPLPDLNDGLVAYYPFNGNANDESGNAYHGNIQNQTAFNPGISGNGIHLTGACASSYYCTGETGGHVLLPYIDFNAMDAFTISLWAKEEEMLIVDGEAYIVFGNSSESNIAIGHYGTMQFVVGNQTLEHPFDNNDLNQWVHWLMKYDNGQLTAYKNGTAIGEMSGISYNITSQLQAIGRHWWYLTSTRYTGMIDEVRIYSRALSEAEIDELYNIQQSFVCGSPFTDSRDGKTYNTVLIGDQCWMKENLAYLPAVSPPNQGSESNPYYYVYNYQGTDINEAKATENYRNYGVLYNWLASLAACPSGWHLPSYTEWTDLTDFLIAQGFPNTNDPVGAGNALKSCRQIESPIGAECSTLNHPRWESDATHYGFDEFGFSALPNGIYDPSGVFSHIGSRGYFWTSTEDSPSGVKIQAIFNWDSEISRGNIGKSAGMSLRCVKNIQDQANIPTLNTTEVTGITDNTATAGGIIISNGGAPILAHGLCYNTSGNPTIDDGYTMDDSGSDSFSNTITGLNPETTYYLRAYATNAAGTGYGNEISFTTEPAPFNCGEVLTDSRDGKTYATIKIGNQCWMQTNLKAGTLLSLPNYPSDNNTIERWALNNDINIGDTHGSFYTWNELMNYESSESNQGICPDGWHIPTLDEFNVLIDLYGGTSLAGGAMKHNGASGFNATMLGMVDFNPGFYGANFSSFYWTSTPADNGAYNISVLQSGPSVFIQNSTPQTGYLAKCIKNPCTAPTSANAGPDQSNLSSTTTLLAANTPIIGNGIWSITEGDGGSVDEVYNPTSSFTGISGTTYKLVWTITNTCGDISADTVLIHFAQNLNIGDSFGGGIIAYLFQQGDPGYIEGEQHGLIAASIDQGDAQWYVTSYPYITYPPTGATANTLGTGNANTTAIVGIQGIGNYAAKLCYDLVLEGYSDWYLPSKDELGKLYINKSAIGGFSYTAAYWSSSESIVSADNAWFQHFSDGSWYDYIKYNACNIRAVRSF